MKRNLLRASMLVLALALAAQETGNFGTDAPSPTSYIVFGPRVGVCYIFQDTTAFPHRWLIPSMTIAR